MEYDPNCCETCRLMAEVEAVAVKSEVFHSDATVAPEIERAAKALFLYDCLDPRMLWEDLGEVGRSDMRAGAIAVITAWVGQTT